MPNTIAPVFPFDPTGVAVTNKIDNEQQILTAANGVDFHLIVPECAPFFKVGLLLTITNIDNSIRQLVEGVDYQCSHQFISGSRACATPIYGSITILDRTLAGIVKLRYQTIGGTWTVNAAQIAQVLSDTLRNPRITAWEEVTEYPIAFPPVDHQWDLADMVGMSEVLTSINSIRDTLINKIQSDTSLNTQLAEAMIIVQAGGTLDQAVIHMANMANPHQVTAAQVGAYSIADSDLHFNMEAQDREAGDVTALGLARTYADNLNAIELAAITAESTRAQTAEALLVAKTITINSHPLSANVTVTKGDVGLGNCDNTSDVNKPVSTAQAAADAAALASAKAYADSLAAASGVPVGTIIDFPGPNAPSGFLAMPWYAVNISRASYPNLHTLLRNAGYPYGAGDGATTFGMPWEPYGYTGIQAAGNVGTQSVGDNLSHAHNYTKNSSSAPQSGNSTWCLVGSVTATTTYTGSGANYAAGVRYLRCVKY